jgi:lysophospholipid acyltransferase (LPLAT)-like uncharacterized protein
MAAEEQSSARPAAARSSGIVVPHRPKWHARLAARLIHLLASSIALTLRSTFKDGSGYTSGQLEGPVIFALWHNRLALSLIINRKYVMPAQPAHPLAALVSASRDGALLARVLELFGARPVRGSSSRRGGQALLELVSAAEQGCNLAITPDGPRGPCYQVQPGVIAAAAATGLLIVPVSYHLGWKWRLRSWDRFQIPLPFSTWEVEFGEPLRVPRDASEEQREAMRQRLEEELRRLTRD